MSLASTQSDIDTALATLITNINSAQATYLAANGVYWQGLISTTVIPADGNSVAANNLTATPSDQAVTWDTFMGANKPGTLPAAVYVHTFKKPNGVQGYRIQKLFIYASNFYSSVVDSGNDSSGAVSWGSSPDVAAPALPAPTYSSLSVSSGSTAGGTASTATLTGAQSGMTITVGGASATSIVVNSSTSVSFVTPAGTAGAKDVVFTNIDGKSVTATGAFTFSAASAPSIVQYKTGEKSNSGNLDIQLDNSTTSGNCIMLILRSNSGGAWSGLSAWTEVPDTGINGCRMYYRISAGGTISVSFDDNSAAKADEKVGIMFEVENSNASSPIDASYAASPSGTSPDRTSTVDNCLVIRGGGSTDGSVDFETAPSGHTLLARVKRAAGSDVAAIAYKTQASAGAVGSAAWDAGSYSDGCAFTVVVKP